MPRVLLIEDDRAVREGVALALRRQGHDVAAAETGEEGLERLRSFRPDVVVLDLMLPGMPGLDVCRAMRALDQTLPILMATARGDDVDIVVGLEAGADDYVVKPVQARVLEARIRAVLRRATARRRGRADALGLLRGGRQARARPAPGRTCRRPSRPIQTGPRPRRPRGHRPQRPRGPPRPRTSRRSRRGTTGCPSSCPCPPPAICLTSR
ncbi:response regulator transcription factor [Streptomyces sp. NPDC055506]